LQSSGALTAQILSGALVCADFPAGLLNNARVLVLQAIMDWATPAMANNWVIWQNKVWCS
jgi:hypothetical protein